MPIDMIMFAIFGIAMLTAAWKDLTSYTIPNWISLFTFAGFLLISIIMMAMGLMSLATFGIHLLVGFGALIVMMGMFALNWIGGGDAKLYAATAFWWLPADLLYYTLITTLIGGLFAFLLVIARRFLPVKVRTTGWVHRLLRDEKKMPYGLALSAAALIWLPQSSIFKAITDGIMPT